MTNTEQINSLPEEYRNLERALLQKTLDWVDAKDPALLTECKTLRRKIFLLNHQHYFENIPRYRRLCERAGVRQSASYEDIVNELMITDDYFKSYPQHLIEKKNFTGLTEWLHQISSFPESLSATNLNSIDEWLTKLEQKNLHVVFSSGTSGQMSFVPRDQRTWSHFLNVPYLYLPQILGRRGVVARWKIWGLRFMVRKFSPAKFLDVVKKIGMRDLEGFFMNFSGGNQGIQLVGREAGKLTRSAHYLYEVPMSPSAVRSLIRGPNNPAETEALQVFLKATVQDKDRNYERMLKNLKQAADARRKVMLFGTPYLLKELCEKVWADCGRLPLPRGSHVIYGGGWKSFDGKKLSERELVAMIAKTFAIPDTSIMEGYSMTEINGLLPKCTAGRFHLPPYFEALTFDAELKPQRGIHTVGTLGILDPFARSYPGFLITGDLVALQHDQCTCGLLGSSILQVERAPGREVKGCGGIMATVNA